MKLYESILYGLLIVLLCQCKAFQYQDTSRVNSRKNITPPNEEGKCFAKCLMGDVSEKESEDYIVYTGDESKENVDVEIRKVVIQKADTKWIKKKTDRNCLSKDPNDCLVWCLTELPEITEELKILTDTTQSKNYEIKTIEFETVIKKGGFTEWRSVLCEGDITNLVIVQIQNSLKEKKYYEKEITQILDTQTKAALTKYQKDNNLPVGQLDFDTLEALGVNL